MKKLIVFALMLGFLLLTQSTPTAHACLKNAWLASTGDGDWILEVGENIVWNMAIYIGGDRTVDWTNVVVMDKLGGELEIDSIDSLSQGTVSYYTTGKTEKVHLTWEVGTLGPGDIAILWFTVSTDINPAGHQEYTTPGYYWLNSGPSMKWEENGIQQSEEVPGITITVLPPD